MTLKVMLAKSFELDMKLPKELIDLPPPINWIASEKLDENICSGKIEFKVSNLSESISLKSVIKPKTFS